jgi:repressor LexA
MGKSACWAYVTWYNEASSGNWATWEPGELVNPGDVGRFDENRRFQHCDTLASYKINFMVSKEHPIAPRLYATGKTFRVVTKAAGQAAAGFTSLGGLDAGVKFTAEREHSCLLQLQEATESHILTKTHDLLQQIAALVRSGEWDLDLAVVVRRVRAKRGFAAISQGAGQSVELKATGDVNLAEDFSIGGAELLLASDMATTGFMFYEFGNRTTPVFYPPIRVRQSLWDRLLPWRREGPWLIDPAGGRHQVSSLMVDLSGFLPQDRRYDPRRSAITPDEITGISADELFEEVTSLPGIIGGISVLRSRAMPEGKSRDFAPQIAAPIPEPEGKSRALTWRQHKIIQFIRDSMQRGYSPSLREIAEAVGLKSSSSVSSQLAALEEKGYLHRRSSRARTVEVQLSRHLEPEFVPLVGRIAAGLPILAEQMIEDIFPLPRQIVGEGTLFMLRVVGDSMIDLAIADGDWVVVRQQSTAENGEIVAALLGDQATIKTLKWSNGRAWLVPANPGFVPFLADNAIILGRVIAIMRRI